LREEKIDETNFLFSARLDVDYINENYKLELPESDEYETLGGFIVYKTGEIPEQDSEIIIDNFQFTILEVSNTKIDLVALKIIEED